MLEADLAQVGGWTGVAGLRPSPARSACPAWLLTQPPPSTLTTLELVHTQPQMRAMFYADGDGIPLDEVDALCRGLSDCVDAMGLDTGLVIQNLKQVGVLAPLCDMQAAVRR